MAGHAAVCIHNDLASRQAAVPLRTTDDKITRWVDMEQRVGVQPLCGKSRFDNFPAYRLAEVFLRDIGVVLRREHNGFHALGFAIGAVAHGELALRVRPQPR